MDKDKDKKLTRPGTAASDSPSEAATDIDDFFRGLGTGLHHPKPSADAVAAAMEAAQRLAAEADVEDAVGDSAHEIGDAAAAICRACRHRNRAGNRFCAMCGAALVASNGSEAARDSQAIVRAPNAFLDEPESRPPAGRPTGFETHHYHHHYHHHYFPGGSEGAGPRGADLSRADSGRDSVPGSMLRPNTAPRGEMNRAEATVRHMTHEWVLACNTKHLDDLLELYIADGLVLRSNYPPVRGAAAVREFFFGVLNAGFGEVELDPLRLEVVGDLAYEAGRCKALVPSAAGKRREERGKYLWVFARQGNGEWKLAVDCWSSDLTLTMLESDVPAGPAVRTNQPRKNS